MRGVALTKRQEEALTIIRRHVRIRGVPPSRSELAREMNLPNPSAVDGYLRALSAKGWCQVYPAIERGIKLLREGAPILDHDEAPSINAGSPVLAEEKPSPVRLTDFESVPGVFDGKPDYFARVSGDSMERIGLKSGDLVAIRLNPSPRDGDIVVARINQDITLKRYQRTDENTVELQPMSSNPEHETNYIKLDTEDFEIVGVMVGAIIGAPKPISE